MIIDQPLYFRLTVAKGTGRIFPDLERLEFRFQGMVNQELSDQGFPFSQNQLDRFGSLNQSNLPGHNSQDTCFVSAGNETRWGRFRKEATQTGPPVFWKKDAGLAFKLEDTSVNVGLPCEEGSVIDEIFRWEIVRPINDEIIFLKNFEGILWGQSLLVGYNLHIGINSMNGLFG